MQEILPKMKKIVLKSSETRFQYAETRFQNTKTALSRIFFARNGIDSAQKKPVHFASESDPSKCHDGLLGVLF